MRARVLAIAAAAALMVSGLPACGLDQQGLLSSSGGGSGASSSKSDAGTVQTTDGSAGDDGTGSSGSSGDDTAPDDAATGDDASGDDDSGAAADASPGAPDAKAPDAATMPPTCSSCAATNCPSEMAACAAGSDCVKFRNCQLACAVSSGSSCSNTCGSKYPAGQTAFTDLTLCVVESCNPGCVAAIAIGQ